MDTGNLADIAAALAGVASAVLAAAALRTARAANATARRAEERETERDQKTQAWQAAVERRESERDRRELDRDRRRLAGSLQAWWAKRLDGSAEVWGVIVSNEGPEPAVFRDVRITARGNRYGSDIVVRLLPPGRYFVTTDCATRPWSLPRAVRPSETYEAITRSEKHAVDTITFVDPLSTTWEWTAARGLRQASDV